MLCYVLCPDGHHEALFLPTKGSSVVPWDSLLPGDQSFQRDKHPDAGEGAACDLCVCSPHPSAFFAEPAMQSTATSSAAQPVDSWLQQSSLLLHSLLLVPPLCYTVKWGASRGSGKAVKPYHPKTQKKGKKPRVLKRVRLRAHVDKYRKHWPGNTGRMCTMAPCTIGYAIRKWTTHGRTQSQDM